MTHEISDAEAELINECLLFIYNYPAPRDLGRVFINESKGTQHRIQVLMVNEGLIELVDGLRVGHKAALITNTGNRVIVNYGSFMKYIKHRAAEENEIERKASEAEARDERNTRANERNVTWTGLNTLLTVGMFLLAALACWQTFRASDKDKVIEIQKKHIQQLQERIK